MDLMYREKGDGGWGAVWWTRGVGAPWEWEACGGCEVTCSPPREAGKIRHRSSDIKAMATAGSVRVKTTARAHTHTHNRGVSGAAEALVCVCVCVCVTPLALLQRWLAFTQQRTQPLHLHRELLSGAKR